MNNLPNRTGLEREKIIQAVSTSLQELLATLSDDSTRDVTITAQTRLIGRDAVLDSMGLVSLIVDIEQRLENEFGVALVLADERAMSQKHSPFRSVQTLSDYIYQLTQEQVA